MLDGRELTHELRERVAGIRRKVRSHTRAEVRRVADVQHTPFAVDDVFFGCVDAIGPQAGDIARTAWLAAGMPEEVPGTTIDRQCGSSQQT